MPDEIIGVYAGDSKVKGLGGVYSMLGLPSPSSVGAGYTAVDAVTLSGTTDGTGGIYSARLISLDGATSNGTETIFPSQGGSGYVDETKAPVINLAGGTKTTAAVTAAQYAGGIAAKLDAQIKTAGGNIRTLNLGRSGAGTNGLDPRNGFIGNSILAALALGPRAFLYISCGVNDAANGVTAADYRLYLDGLVSQFPTVPIFLAKTCGVPNTQYPNAAAINTLVQSYGAQVDSVAAANPSRVKVIQDEYALLATHPEYFGIPAGSPNLHQNDAGYVFMAQENGARLIAALKGIFPTGFTTTGDPYQSDNAIPVVVTADYKPGAPGPLIGSGLGTLLLPRVELTYPLPADLPGGRIVFLRRVYNSNTPFAVVGNVTGTDRNTEPPTVWDDTNVVNGTRYEYTAYALPFGDF